MNQAVWTEEDEAYSRKWEEAMAERDGVEANVRNEPRETNPYKEGTMARLLWWRGWDSVAGSTLARNVPNAGEKVEN